MIEFKDITLLAILDITRKQSKNQHTLRAHYKKQVLKYHPDKARFEPAKCHRITQCIIVAYEILKDEEKRREYARLGKKLEGIDWNTMNQAGEEIWQDSLDQYDEQETPEIDDKPNHEEETEPNQDTKRNDRQDTTKEKDCNNDNGQGTSEEEKDTRNNEDNDGNDDKDKKGDNEQDTSNSFFSSA